MKKAIRYIDCLILLFLTFLFYPASAQVITNKNIYWPSAPPKIPLKGSKFTDPVFGTTLLRVTDSTDGKINTHAYSYWLTMNKNDSFLYVFSEAGQAILYDFDTTNFLISNKRIMFKTQPSGGIFTEDAMWSAKSNNLMICHGYTKLYSYDVVKDSSTLIHDFTSQIPGEYLWQMSRDDNDNVFAFTRRDSTNHSFLGYLVYIRSTNSIFKANYPGLDEVQVDKTGKHVLVKTGKQGSGAVEAIVLNMQTFGMDSLIANAPDFAPGHSDNGSGLCVGYDNYNNALTIRKMATPHTYSQIINYGNDWTNALHLSMRAADASWATISMFSVGGLGTGLFKDEIFQLATDGSGNVQRLAHHHSLYKSYYDSPRGVISMDGKFITFSSNWGDTLREDVFVLKVPPYPITTGVSSGTDSKNDFSVYPNPVEPNGTLFIKTNNNLLKSGFLEVSLTNAIGQQIYRSFYQNTDFLELSTERFPAGIYLLRLIDSESVRIKKIIIQ